MVFFNCNACGEALKKNQVEKHTYRCRQCEAVSCVDCGKDFWGSEYESHTKCMTEDEKYCGKGYVAKVNKGEAKQEQWIEKVQDAIEKASSNVKLKGLLERLKDYPNIPRKKQKFENFVKNSLRVLSPALISQVWDLLMTAANTAPEAKQNGSIAPPITPNGDVKNSTADAKIVDNTKDQANGNDNTVDLNKRERKEERQKKSKKEKKDKVDTESSSNAENLNKKKKRKHVEIQEEAESESNRANEVIKKNKKRKKEEVLEDQSNLSEEPVTKKKRKKDKQADGEPSGDEISATKQRKKKKETSDVEGEEDEKDQSFDEPSTKKRKFKWGATITAILEKKGEMSLKKLRKKVLNEFSAQDAANYSEENLMAKFNKKINKMPRVQVLKERVKLK